LAAADDAEAIRAAEDQQFRLVDLRITSEKRLDRLPTHPVKPLFAGIIRDADPQDIPVLRAIARECYHDSRYYYDVNFARALVDALYETWIEKSCHGYADLVLVVEEHGQPVGYISCHRRAPTVGSIGLFGVAAAAQNQGLGRELLEAACRWFAEQEITRVKVVTQGRNIRAQRLYQRCGFLTQSVQLWYHRWFT
jgi:dTDP-4-amino-4,6-dideoxy-D-galactose acyltransferase